MKGPLASLVGALLLTAGLGTALGGCGFGDARFDAESAVAELNAAGAELELGEPLETSDPDIEVRVVKFTGGSGPLDGDVHGSGAVVVLDDDEAALEEFGRCDSAVSFICFRAANTVFRFENISPLEQAQITGSMQALATAE